MNEIFIYTLTNPFTGNIYYVGQTVNLEQRRNAHPVCRSLDKTERPIIEEIDRCSESDKLSVENYWICQFHEWGFKLSNNYVPGVRMFRHSQKKDTQRVKVKRKIVPAGFRAEVIKEMCSNMQIHYVVSEYFKVKYSTAVKMILADNVKLTQYSILVNMTSILGYSHYEELFIKAA